MGGLTGYSTLSLQCCWMLKQSPQQASGSLSLSLYGREWRWLTTDNRYQDMQVVGPNGQKYEQPVFQTVTMFVGET